MHFFGKLPWPTALKDLRSINLRSEYSSRANGWMDSKKFAELINQSYNEVRKLSDGPWCLKMGNCGGNELNLTIPGVEIIYLPPRSTSKHQPLELGLIVNAKIRY